MLKNHYSRENDEEEIKVLNRISFDQLCNQNLGVSKNPQILKNRPLVTEFYQIKSVIINEWFITVYNFYKNLGFGYKWLQIS